MPTDAAERRDAARQLRAMLDSNLFRALCEPVRVDLAVHLTEHGPADVRTIAEHFPQHSTVISRHLATLADAGVLVREKRGRHVYFGVDGAGMVARMQAIVDRFRDIVPLCCPAGDVADVATAEAAAVCCAAGDEPAPREPVATKRAPAEPARANQNRGDRP